MSIRKAKIEDSDIVANLYIESRNRHIPFAKLAHGEDETRVWMRDQLIPSGNVFVLENDGSISAMMSCSTNDQGSWIDQLYVKYDLVGQGFGRLLLEYAKEILDRPIYLYTFQQNEGARRFYEKNGFDIIRFSDGSRNEEQCPDILYGLKNQSPNN